MVVSSSCKAGRLSRSSLDRFFATNSANSPAVCNSHKLLSARASARVSRCLSSQAANASDRRRKISPDIHLLFSLTSLRSSASSLLPGLLASKYGRLPNSDERVRGDDATILPFRMWKRQLSPRATTSHVRSSCLIVMPTTAAYAPSSTFSAAYQGRSSLLTYACHCA